MFALAAAVTGRIDEASDESTTAVMTCSPPRSPCASVIVIFFKAALFAFARGEAPREFDGATLSAAYRAL